ncbi:hypothetical protein JNUCC0626_10150 [Lentzea sp. JNUCC 0626]|uniref:hypothetical protein n=1 Tax=Lentzea sp. JNUCC 0626 TaxID=3367513 RepID=UPI003749ECD1
MLTKFWEAAGGKLADRWLTVSAPAFLFWSGGVLAWAHSAGGWSGAEPVVAWLSHRPAVVQGGALLVALVLVAGSGVVVDRLSGPALRIAEGYWPGWVLKVWWRLARVAGKRTERRQRSWQALQRRIADEDPALRPEDFATYLRLDRAQRRQASVPYRRMPTRIGAILRAAESWPLDKYGLETTAVWPRLWLLLPELTRDELIAARRAVTGAVVAALWGLLFTTFGALTPWAVLVGLTVSVLALCVWLPPRAQAFADLLEAAFDLHRSLLYQHLRWPLPANPAGEQESGRALTAYLWRGSDAAKPSFAKE